MATLTYAGLTIADRAAASLTWGPVEARRNAAGVIVSYLYQCAVGRAGLACNGAADAAVKMALVEQILRVENQPLAFDAARSVAPANTIGGVRWVSGPVWSNRPGANGLTFVEWSGVAVWERFADVGAPLVDFQEVVTIEGGLPTRVGFATVNTDFSVVQTTTATTPYTATQTGYAVGLVLRPFPNPPIWPHLQTGPNPVALTSSRRIGNVYVDRRVDWAYRYVSNTPFEPYVTEWSG